MAIENSLITLLQPPASVETPAVNQTGNGGGDDQFQNMLEEASRNVKRTEENASTRKERQGEPVSSNNKSQADQSSRAADSGERTEGRPGPKDNETFEPELTSASQGVENSQGLSQERADSLTDSRNAFVEGLQSLGIDQEKIDAFLRLLEIDTADAGAQELIMALTGQLGLQQGGKLAPVDRLAVDFLRQAGLSEAEAKNLLQRIAYKTDVLNLQETRNVQSAIAPGTQSPEDTARAAHVQARQAGSEITVELINKQRLEAQKLSSQKQIANTKAGLSSERIETQDPLAKVLNSPQLQQNPSGENAPQTNMPNFLNLRNFQDNVSPLDQGAAKISVESLAQNNYQSVAKLSGQTEALKETAKEASLPRGVTENKVIDQIVRKFSVRGIGAKNEIHIRLEPPSLGTVRMNISTVGDSMKTTVIAENHAVRQVIESNLSQLKDSLSQQGFTVESFDVLVGGDPGFKGQGQQLRNGRSNGFYPGNPLGQETLELLASESPPPLFAGTGKINVFA